MKINLNDALNVIDVQQKIYIELAKKDKSKKKQVDAIITATTLLKIELQKLPKTFINNPKQSKRIPANGQNMDGEI